LELSTLSPGLGAAFEGGKEMVAFKMFEGLSKSDIDHIFDIGVIRPIEAGELIFRKGAFAKEMYVILTGKINIVDELKPDIVAVIAEVGPGEVLGEMAVFDESHEHSAHALAKESSQVLVLSEKILTELFESEIPKKFLINIIGMLCHRLRTTNRMYMGARYSDKLVPKEKSQI
jgi:CRP-like cAMP-binding protein